MRANVLCCLLCTFVFQASELVSGMNKVPEYISNFGNFTDQLVHILETSEPTEHRPGVHLYTPFGIGYLLANMYEKLWPVPVKEIPESIFTLRKYVATDYAALLRLFKKRQFRVSSTIYTRFGNVTKPPTFKQLLTQVISLDMFKNRTEFRESIKQIIERGTKGHLDQVMLPQKEPAWREIFDNTTHGVYANTLYYKSEWDKPWRSIGERKFFDNSVVPFIELQGEYEYAEADNATAVIINFQASMKQVILFKPRDFTSVTDMRRIVRGMLNNATIWKVANVTIQMPSLNVTNLSQPSDKFPFLGVMDTFCRGRYMDPTQYYFNQHPMAHANHFEFSPEFLEIASSTGSLIAYQNNKDFVPKPPANQTHHESGTSGDVDYFDILEATEEEDKQFEDYIVDARSDLPFSNRFRGEFNINFHSRGRSVVSNSSGDFQECDPISAMFPDDHGNNEMMSTFNESVSVNKSSMTTSHSGRSAKIIIRQKIQSKPQSTSLPEVSTVSSGMDKMTMTSKLLVLDTPFSWILRDKEIGEVFYGSVSSLCQYNRAVKHIPTVPTWVLDLFKAFYWRCV